MKKKHGLGTQRESCKKKWPFFFSDDFGLRSVLSHSATIFTKKRYTSIVARVSPLPSTVLWLKGRRPFHAWVCIHSAPGFIILCVGSIAVLYDLSIIFSILPV